jgi:hypothetical protein
MLSCFSLPGGAGSQRQIRGGRNAALLIERNFAEAIEVTKEGADQIRQTNDEEGV